ncbi:MAG: hypothetical protein QOE99_1678 [Actinomycetota bacterium]|nr:hypothetical protein [Actinomycetota bacterium]
MQVVSLLCRIPLLTARSGVRFFRLTTFLGGSVSVRPRRPIAGAACLLVLAAGALAGAPPASADTGPSPFTASRADAPVVLTGAQIPQWSGPSADGVAAPYPSGSLKADGGDGVRSAHNGTMVIPPATGVDTDQVSAWKWNGTGWAEVPVQVDQKFPYFLANGHSDFAVYSGTDKELTYAWAPDKHATGAEAWKKIFGECSARYASTDPVTLAADIATASKTSSAAPLPAYSPAAGETPADYTHAMQDPVPTLDNDDEIAFQAGDAGSQAPASQPAPAGTTAGSGQTVAVADPTSGAVGYVYLFLKPGGSSFDAANGYVKMTRDATADEWIDRDVFKPGSTQQLGSSNTGYGPNLQGTVCQDANGPTAPRFSKDRFPSDAVTVTSDRYKLRATGRWMVRDYSVAKPGQPGTYGPDLIDRWKGRAFQQSPDSSVSVVGFEDEQVNWEANGALLGWRQGPVRAIREIWGADSGTNVTKTETYYRNADTYRYHVRVHPIPPDGLYTSWDYNKATASTYYNTLKPAGVPIDGVNDDTGQVDQLPDTGVTCPYAGAPLPKRVPCPGDPAYIDTPDPTFDLVSAVDRPEEVAGKGDAGAVAYVFEFKGATSAANAAAVPYYRDDACLDDGTGDDPVARPQPGEASTDSRVQQGYVDYWKAHGAPSDLTYADLKCDPANTDPAVPEWKKTPFQGAFASHGIHFFTTHDSDNATVGASIDEIDGQQWRFAIPEAAPTNWIGGSGDPTKDNYGLNVDAPLQAQAFPYGQVAPDTSVPEVPFAALMPLVAIGVIGGGVWLRRRRTAVAV